MWTVINYAAVLMGQPRSKRFMTRCAAAESCFCELSASCKEASALKIIRRFFAIGYSGIVLLFICCAIALIIFAVLGFWHGINPGEALFLRERFNAVLESIGLLTIAVVALELGQTILEEEAVS